MNCAWLSLTKGTPCMFGCGTTLPRDYDEPPVCVCPGPQSQESRVESREPGPPGLGDAVEALLASIGITKDRYRQVKQMFGLPPTCGCDEVQSRLNRIEWFKPVAAWWAKKPR